MSRIWAILTLTSIFFGCGDLTDTEISRGEYSVYFHEAENTEMQAKALLAYMDSTKAPFSTVRLSSANEPMDSTLKGVSLFVEAQFKHAKDDDEQRLFAARLARRLSEDVFDSVYCSLTLVSSIDAVGIEGLRGTSKDPRLQ